jgi:transcription elongation GreA/GreB family factor
LIKNIKEKLVDKCKLRIQEEIEFLQKVINDSQEDANQYKGAMESRHDTFKEEAQNKKEAYIIQLDRLRATMSNVMSIEPTMALSHVQHGAVVITDKFNLFFCGSIFSNAINLDGDEYTTISITSPIGQALKNKEVGDSACFNNISITIKDIC